MEDNICPHIAVLEQQKANTAKWLSLSDFSFAESQQTLKTLTTSLSEAIIEERRSCL